MCWRPADNSTDGCRTSPKRSTWWLCFLAQPEIRSSDAAALWLRQLQLGLPAPAWTSQASRCRIGARRRAALDPWAWWHPLLSLSQHPTHLAADLAVPAALPPRARPTRTAVTATGAIRSADGAGKGQAKTGKCKSRQGAARSHAEEADDAATAPSVAARAAGAAAALSAGCANSNTEEESATVTAGVACAEAVLAPEPASVSLAALLL
jgi:hypothetical protein